MLQVFKKLILRTKSYEILNITSDLEKFIKSSNFNNGLINISILHTSCSLMIQENADQNVLKDITIFLKRLHQKIIIFMIQRDLTICLLI